MMQIITETLIFRRSIAERRWSFSPSLMTQIPQWPSGIADISFAADSCIGRVAGLVPFNLRFVDLNPTYHTIYVDGLDT
ncbi:MAG: hypothetical protein VB824_10085 [Dehalococcoidia bacterium]